MAAMKRSRRRWVLALVGGVVGRVALHIPKGVELRRYTSVKEGGTGQLRRLLASIEHGGVDEVWILRWIGHSESGRIVQVCKRHGIHVRLPEALRRGKQRRRGKKRRR